MKLKTSLSDPNSIVYTHFIPPISQREKGAKVSPRRESDTVTEADEPTFVVSSDGDLGRLSDGTFRTAVPYPYLNEWRNRVKRWLI